MPALRNARLRAQALSSYRGEQGQLTVLHLAGLVQQQLVVADTLVRKYGHERLWDSLLRRESKVRRAGMQLSGWLCACCCEAAARHVHHLRGLCCGCVARAGCG